MTTLIARGKSISLDFFSRDTATVARDLLGKILIVRPTSRSGVTAGRIVETEAYRGPDDPASHSFRGPTERCRIMFGEPGRVYVYFIYGMHEMLNFVTEPEGRPGAVLIRAVEPVSGESLMARRRPGVARGDWTNGPGRLCRAMGVRLSHNGERLDGPLFRLLDDGAGAGRILVSPRVGIRVGMEAPWRFFIEGNPFVSACPQNARARPYS